jgi:Gly-Xaa carboxypeptidase
MPIIPTVDYYHASAEEKELGQGLSSVTDPHTRRPCSRVCRALRWAVVLAVVVQGLLVVYPNALNTASETVSHGCSAAAHAFTRTKADRVCPQEEALVPQGEDNAKLWEALGKEIGSEEFKERAIKWHSGAVQIPTETYNMMGPVDEDPRWEAFVPFQEYLLKVFPNVYVILFACHYY